VADDDGTARRRQRAGDLQRPGEQRAAEDGVEDLRDGRAHARAAAGGEDEHRQSPCHCILPVKKTALMVAEMPYFRH
jgi:hypothetical protein